MTGRAGRPCKLDERLLPRIREAMRLGMAEEDAARACGVSPRSWLYWKNKGLAAIPLLEGGWRKLRVEQLRQIAGDLNVTGVVGTGRGGAVLKGDLGPAVEEKAQIFLRFLQELEDAEPFAEANALATLDLLKDGGHLGMVNPRTGKRQPLKRTRTTEVERLNKDGDMIVVERTTTVELIEAAPSERAAKAILSLRWPDKYGRRKAIDPDKSGEDSAGRAKRIYEAAQAMFDTVPGEDEDEGGRGGGGSG